MKTKRILGISIISTFVFLLLFLILKVSLSRGWIVKTLFKERLSKWGLILLLIILGALSISYLILYIIKKDKNEQELKPIKQPVDITPAIELWKQEFIRLSGIPHIIIQEKEPMIKLQDSADLTILNGKKFDDKETGDNFYRFEVYAKKGIYAGLNIVMIPIDKGKDYIKNNCLWWIKHNTPLEMLKLEKEFPLTSIQDQNLRVELLKQTFREEEDYDERELRYLEAMKSKPQNVKKEQVITESDIERAEIDAESKRLQNAVQFEKLRKEREG